MPVIVTAKPAAPAARPKSAEPVELPPTPDEPVPSRSTLAAAATADGRRDAAVAVETAAPPGPAGRRDGPREVHRPRRGDRQSAGRRHGSKAADRKRGDGAGSRRASAAGRQARADAEVEPPSRGSRQPTSRPLRSPTCGCRPMLSAPASRAASRWPRICAAMRRTLDEEKKQRGAEGPRTPGAPPRPTRRKSRGKGKHRRGKDATPMAKPKIGRCSAAASSGSSRAAATPRHGDDGRYAAALAGAADSDAPHVGASTAAPRKERVTHSAAVHGPRAVGSGRRAGRRDPADSHERRRDGHDHRRDGSGNDRARRRRAGHQRRIQGGGQPGRPIARRLAIAGRRSGRAGRAAAGHHVPGPRRPRQDVAAWTASSASTS